MKQAYKYNLHAIIRLAFVAFLLCYSIPIVYAQKQDTTRNETDDTQLQDALENILIDSDSESDAENAESVSQTLEDYLNRPLNINKVTAEELEDFPFLSAQQISGILKYRDNYGPYINLYELQAVPEIDVKTAKQLAPFFRMKDLMSYNVPLGALLVKGNHTVIMRYQQVLQQQAGYVPKDTLEDGSVVSRYKGSQARLYARYRYNYGNKISYGITAEKDPGEDFFTGSNKKGFDFYSAHFYLRNTGIFKHIALGDYEVRLGQGLVVATGLASRKSAFVMNVSHQGPPIKPYTSVNEATFMRGAATTIGIKKWELTVFGSYRKLDGNVSAAVADTTTIDPEGEGGTEETTPEDNFTDSNLATSIQTSGFHRTDSEIDDRGALTQLNGGGSFGYKSRQFTLCGNMLYSKFNKTFNPSDQPYNLYRFDRDQLINASIDYKYIYRNLNFFGETAVSDNGGVASINGVLAGLSPQTFLSVVHRYITPNYQYHPLFGNGFTENSRPVNEHGLFVGAIFKPIKYWTINAYADMYRFPWLRSTASAPSYGSDYLLKVVYQPERTVEMYAQYRYESKMDNANDDEVIFDYLTPHIRSSLRYQIQYKITPDLTLRSRAEWSWFEDGTNPKENGYAIMQDIMYKPLSKPYSFNARFALFDTDSYNTRIYAYENDVLYQFSIPPYNNQGTRFYLNVRLKPMRHMDIWLRYAQTHYTNINEIGSGNELISGKNRSEIKAMVRYVF